MGKEAAQMSHCCPGAALLGAAHLRLRLSCDIYKDNRPGGGLERLVSIFPMVSALTVATYRICHI